jgi:hypothetical protein
VRHHRTDLVEQKGGCVNSILLNHALLNIPCAGISSSASLTGQPVIVNNHFADNIDRMKLPEAGRWRRQHHRRT